MAGKSTKFQLEVILRLNDQLSGKLGRSTSALKKFEAQATTALKAYDKFQKALSKSLTPPKPKGILPDLERATKLTTQLGARQLADATRLVRLDRERARLATEETRAAREQARLALDSHSQSLRLQREQTRLAADEARARRATQQASSSAEIADLRAMREQIRLKRESERYHAGHRPPGMVERLDRFGRRADNLRYATHDFRSAFDTVREAARPAIEQLRAEAEFRFMNVPEASRAAGLEAVNRVVTETRGVRQADVTKDLTALVGVTGSVEEAAPLLPLFAKYRAGMEARFGDKVSPEAVTQNIANTMRAIELLGKDLPTGRDAQGRPVTTPEDTARIARYADMIMKASAASGGDVNPTKFRQFAQYSRTAGMSLSEEGTLKALPLVQQMGGTQAGVALASLQQALIGGQMPSYKLEEWQRMGWIQDPKKIIKTKGGMRVLPGGIRHTDKLLTDPMAFTSEIEKHFRTQMGIDTQDPKAVNAQLYKMFGNRVPMGMVAQAINAQAALEKEAVNYGRAFDINAVYSDLFGRDNPLGKFLDLEVKADDAQARAAMDVVQKGGGLAGKAADWIGQHPDAAAAVTGLSTLASVSMQAASGVGSLAAALAGMGHGGGGGGGVGSGGWFGTGWDTSDVAGAGYLGMKGLRALVPRLGLPGLIVGGAAASIYGLHSRYQHDTENRRKVEGDAGAGFEQLKRMREQAGGVLPPEVARDIAARAFPGVDRRGLLNELDVKTYGGPGYPGVMAQPQYDRNQLMAGAFARRAPELQFPELMRGFIESIKGQTARGEIKQPNADAILKVAQLAFPDSFKAASESAAAELAKIPQPAQQAAEALLHVYDPAQRLKGGLGQAQAAAVNFASRVNALDIRASFPFSLPPPNTIGGITIPGSTTKPGAQGGNTFAERFYGGVPRSAAGSVVQSDGLVSAHTGNVIFPASLSRRTPGDWLEDLDVLTGGGSDARGEYADRAGVVYSPHYELHVGSVGDVDAIISDLERRQAADRARLRSELMAALDDPRRFRRQLRAEEARRREVA